MDKINVQNQTYHIFRFFAKNGWCKMDLLKIKITPKASDPIFHIWMHKKK